jgi:hypothetical protein
MPGYFLNSGFAILDIGDVMAGLSEFVAKVLGWCEGLADSRIDRLQADWNAITNADAEERAFCRAAGRMGLDPYLIETWDPGLVDLLSTGLGSRVDDDIVKDLLESAVEPASVIEMWRWVSNTESSLGLTAGGVGEIDDRDEVRTAKDQGYKVARWIRQMAGLSVNAPIDDIASVVLSVGGTPFSFDTHNHVPGRAVLATVGWRDDNKAVIAGPRPARLDSARFLESRGLYLALEGCRRGARLITRAYTWDQQASRAFAAELLAPQAALCERAIPDMEPDERWELENELATRFGVSTDVIGLQLRNAGVWRDAGG